MSVGSNVATAPSLEESLAPHRLHGVDTTRRRTNDRLGPARTNRTLEQGELRLSDCARENQR